MPSDSAPCAKRFLFTLPDEGIDPRTLQGWMGYKDLNTTMRYAHVSPDHEKAAIQRLSYDDGHQVDTTALA